MIAGFIITGTQPKKVIIRALGPSLEPEVTGALQDPVLELHGSHGELIRRNDNWRANQETAIVATGIAPPDNHEAALVENLPPGSYTAIVSGKDETTGVALVDAYDLSGGAKARLANISTRGFEEGGSGVIIGGFILGGKPNDALMVLRGGGPSLAGAVANPLGDCKLELHDKNGATLISNDDWRDTQEIEMLTIGIPPSREVEPAITSFLPPDPYTAILRGKNSTGIGLVEIYNLE